MNIRRMTLGCLLAFAGLGMWACDNTDPGTDAGPTPTDGGGGGTDSGPMGADPIGFGPRLAALSPADFSCSGMEPVDTMGEVAFTGVVTDFFTAMPVSGLTVQFYGDNVVADACAGGCAEATSDAMGGVPLMDNEGSWYGYRILPGTGMVGGEALEYIGLLQANEATPAAGASQVLNTVQTNTRDTIVALLGVSIEGGTATMTGRLRDCDGEAIANATLRLFDSTGEIDLDGSGARAFYFNGTGLPAATQNATHIDGLFGAANIPVTDGDFRIEIWGATSAGGTPEMLACETGLIAGDGITVLNAGPARSDGPTCSI